MLLSCKSLWCKPMSRERNCSLAVVVVCLIICGGGNKRRRVRWKSPLVGQERRCNMRISKEGQDALSGPLPQHPTPGGRVGIEMAALCQARRARPCPPKKSSFRSARHSLGNSGTPCSSTRIITNPSSTRVSGIRRLPRPSSFLLKGGGQPPFAVTVSRTARLTKRRHSTPRKTYPNNTCPFAIYAYAPYCVVRCSEHLC